MPQEPQRERRLFEQALDHSDPEQRMAFLRQACGTDSALLQRLVSLLQAQAQAEAGRFLDRPPASIAPEGPGDRIDRYELVEPIGEGGFAHVFRAVQQEPVRRDVALKILKPGMDSRRVIARFEAERRLLAVMDHPNIARIYDAGATPRGRPYFAMEWVRGQPLTQHSDDAQLALRDRVLLFLEVCDAVHHAHQKGVIHRDLKPSNVLVATHGTRAIPKVIDFGIAKALQDFPSDLPDVTPHQDLLGTPAFMSPEQADGRIDIDVRSDVYSLGLLLQHLLSGTSQPDRINLPHAGWETVRQRILGAEPRRPSDLFLALDPASQQRIARSRHTVPTTLARHLAGDLDWIVLRCLEKDRERRYPSAAALAEDLRRHLAHQPVSAAAPSAAYQLAKFYRRHRVGVGAGLAIAAALVAATGISLNLAWRAHDAEQTARTLLSAEQRQRARVEQLQRQSEADAQRARVEAATAVAVTRFLNEDLLASADPAREPERELTLRTVLDRASQRLASTLTNEPTAAAALHETLGRAYLNLALFPPAVAHYSQARDLHLATRGPDHESTLRATIDLAFARHRSGDTNSALPLALETSATVSSRLGNNHPLAFRCAARLAWIQYQLGRTAEAQQTAEEAYQASLGRADIDDIDLLMVMYLVGRKRGSPRGGVFEAGEQILQNAVQIMREHRGEEDILTTRAKGNLAVYYYDHQRSLDRAESLFLEVLDRLQRILGESHDSPLVVLRNLGLLHYRAGRPAAAQHRFLQVLAHRPDDPQSREFLLRLASHPLPQLLPPTPTTLDWRLTSELPPSHWYAPDFDDTRWTTQPVDPTSRRIWLRTVVPLADLPDGPLVLTITNGSFLEAFLNGFPAQRPVPADQTPSSSRPYLVASPDAMQRLRPGRNHLAVLARADNPSSPPSVTLHRLPSP